MTHSIFHVKIIGGNGKGKELGTFGRLTSAHGLVDRLICRLVKRHKRSLIETPSVECVENDEGVHTFVRLTVRAHKFRRTVHAHHFLVQEEVMEMSRPKTYQKLSNWEDCE